MSELDSGVSITPSPAQGMVRLMLTVASIYADVSRSLGLTTQQAQLLCAARRSAAIGDLATTMRCERSNVSHLLDRAADRGLIGRRAGERDGRVIVVELSPEGQEVVQRFMNALELRLTAAVADWPEKQRAAATSMLNEIVDSLDAGAVAPAETA